MRQAGVERIADLLLHLPLRYEDRRVVTAIGALPRQPSAVTISGRLEAVSARRMGRRRMVISRATVVDDSGRLEAVWFNRPHLERQVRSGCWYLLHGRLKPGTAGVQLLNASLEPCTSPLGGGGLVPVYGRLGSVSPGVVGQLIGRALEAVTLDPDPIPAELLDRHGLPTLGEALRGVHAPDPKTPFDLLAERRSPAHLRLAYGELLHHQLRLARRRARLRERSKPHRYRLDERTRAAAREMLPFRLTGSQRRALASLIEDMRAERPMTRLLQGDVGCGKTAVAAVCLLVALESGHQAAVMAPTELLAEQQWRTLRAMLPAHHRVELLTGSRPDGSGALTALGGGEPMLVVGTHALIEERVVFGRLALAVIDEQHRFGVHQRARLAAKATTPPDVLVMTATPIPRSLALTVYGDLDLSVIDELPLGRQPVATTVLPAQKRGQAVAALRRRLAEGAQGFVVFPMIEGSAAVSSETVEERGAWYRDQLGELRCQVLTGRTPALDRERIMEAFRGGEIDLLLATTVIEVGLDVPNAAIMVIEGAERFGLSQLHQLRGRVGRGRAAAECLAVHRRLTPEARRRLEVFAESSDGFRIAEEDLALRGPGDLLGTQQAGLTSLRAADPLRHADWIERAREDARRLVAEESDRLLDPAHEDR